MSHKRRQNGVQMETKSSQVECEAITFFLTLQQNSFLKGEITTDCLGEVSTLNNVFSRFLLKIIIKRNKLIPIFNLHT